MAELTPDDRLEIAAELRVAATWVAGPRAAKLNRLADRVDPSAESEQPKGNEEASTSETPLENAESGPEAKQPKRSQRELPGAV